MDLTTLTTETFPIIAHGLKSFFIEDPNRYYLFLKVNESKSWNSLFHFTYEPNDGKIKIRITFHKDIKNQENIEFDLVSSKNIPNIEFERKIYCININKMNNSKIYPKLKIEIILS